MNKRFLSIGLGLAALFAGSQATQTTQSAATAPAPDLQQTRDVAAKSWPASVRNQKPAPAKPATPATKQRVEVVARPLAMIGAPVRFIERPGRRKVKYGKSRWVILG